MLTVQKYEFKVDKTYYEFRQELVWTHGFVTSIMNKLVRDLSQVHSHSHT